MFGCQGTGLHWRSRRDGPRDDAGSEDLPEGAGATDLPEGAEDLPEGAGTEGLPEKLAWPRSLKLRTSAPRPTFSKACALGSTYG